MTKLNRSPLRTVRLDWGAVPPPSEPFAFTGGGTRVLRHFPEERRLRSVRWQRRRGVQRHVRKGRLTRVSLTKRTNPAVQMTPFEIDLIKIIHSLLMPTRDQRDATDRTCPWTCF